ncbi:MAG: tetratricopeptide repeat protein, partial [Planctomycetes bacterium]|nr:tetratricopeptide repeat protein [Planctomycetota bacterium]
MAKEKEPERKISPWVVLGILVVALVVVYILTTPDVPTEDGSADLNGPARPEQLGRVPGGQADDSRQPYIQPKTPKTIHPLLDEADDAVLAAGSEEVRSTAERELAEVIRAVAQAAEKAGELESLTVDYPLDETVFPPEIVAPTFLWHEPDEQADTWLLDVGLGDGAEHLYVLSPGNPPPAGEIDPECITKSNEIYRPTPYQAAARSWTPNGELWAAIKRGSVGLTARVTVVGFSSKEPAKALSRGRISITTSEDPVGAPIFYRDVPLAPAITKKGVIKPLGDEAVTLIGWRLRDISQPKSRLLLTDIPKCTNCHSFSADGQTLGMDLDGPEGDKGSYVIAPLARETVLAKEDVISWNSFPGKPEEQKTIGFLSRMSPDGRYSVTTLNEAVYVCNFMDYRFLQVFFPTRGILGYYNRSTDEIKAIPGADDPEYVHCDPVWSPDGESLVFARAEAKEPYPEDDRLAQRANDPIETQIQYDLYRMPFRGGRGGKPEPVVGASSNGVSNTFPKVSPDGKWIVFVKCRNGQLMRPDSTLWIVPTSGGTARRMRCNTSRMNSWHSFSPNGRWMVFSSKANTPYTQMFLSHIDENGDDGPAILVPNSTAANRAVNLPEFLNRPYEELVSIRVPAIEHLQHGLRGIRLGRKGRFDEAMAEFEAAVKIQPDYWEGHINAAVILIGRGLHAEAMDRLSQVLQRAPERSEARTTAGVTLAENGMLDGAIDYFRGTIQRDPGFAEAHANLARLLLIKGSLEEASAHFRTATELDPENALGHFELGGVLFRRGMPDEACWSLQRALKIVPGFLDARLTLGRVLAMQGKFPAARVQLEEAIKVDLDPDNPWTRNELAWLLAVCPQDDVRDGTRAVQLAERACAVSGHVEPVLLTTLAAAYAEAGRFPEAVATATKALGLVDPREQVLAQTIRQHLQLYQAG